MDRRRAYGRHLCRELLLTPRCAHSPSLKLILPKFLEVNIADALQRASSCVPLLSLAVLLIRRQQKGRTDPLPLLLTPLPPLLPHSTPPSLRRRVRLDSTPSNKQDRSPAVLDPVLFRRGRRSDHHRSSLFPPFLSFPFTHPPVRFLRSFGEGRLRNAHVVSVPDFGRAFVSLWMGCADVPQLRVGRPTSAIRRHLVRALLLLFFLLLCHLSRGRTGRAC